jgi:hypothetical protein
VLAEESIALLDAPHPAAAWAEEITLDPLQVDCVTTIVLSILDNRCELGLEEQIALMAVYSVVKQRNGVVLDRAVHRSIERAQALRDQQTTREIRELRLHAERVVPCQIMNHFKRLLHESLYGFQLHG